MAKGSKEYTMWVELRGKTEKFTQDMNSALGKITGVEKKLTGVAKNIQRAFQAAFVVAGLAAVKKMADGLRDLADAGEEAGSIGENFKKLGGSASQIDKAKASVMGMVESFDLMQISNKGLLAQIPGWNRSFAEIAELGGRVADALGKDTKQSIDDLTEAIVKGQFKALKPLGFAFTDTANKALVTKEALAQLPEVIARLAPVTDSVSNAQNALSVAFDEAYKRIGIAINANPELQRTYRELATTIDEIDWTSFAEGIAAVVTITVKAAEATAWLAKSIKETYSLMAGTSGYNAQVAGAKKFGADIGGKFKSGLSMIDDAGARAKTIADIQKAKNALADFGKTNQQLISQSGDLQAMWMEQSKALFAYEEALKKTAGTTGGVVPPLVKGAKDAVPKIKAEVIEPIATDLAAQMKAAHEDSVAFWESTFENAITGVTFNLEDALKQVAVGFAAEMAASLTGISFSGDVKGFGASIAQQILGSYVSGGGGGGLMQGAGLTGAGSILGEFGMSGAAAQSAGIAGPAMANGMFSAGSGALGAAGPALPYVAAAYAAYKIADHFGVFENKRHPDTQGRRDVAGWLEEKTGKNFVLGADSKFNTEAGFAALHKLDQETQNVFGGLAEAIKVTAGVTGAVTEQIATALVENTGESVDAAKRMWNELGLNAEEVQQKIIEAGIAAGKSWLEIEGQLEQVDRLAAPGLDKFADYQGAFQAMIDSGGQGLGATGAVIASGFEAAEKQFKNFEEWKNALKQTFDPKEVDIFFQALSQRGVTDFDQLKNASTRTAGAIIADMQALGFAFEDVTAKINEAAIAVNGMTGGGDGGSIEIPKMAKGGIVTRPTFAMIGEAGPEVVLPLSKFGAGAGGMFSGGGMGGTVVNIDARGAGPGVEQKIMRVMREISDASVAQGINSFIRSSQRGGRGSLR